MTNLEQQIIEALAVRKAAFRWWRNVVRSGGDRQAAYEALRAAREETARLCCSEEE